MIKKVKDLSQVSLNPQDVMLMAKVKSKIKSNLDLSAVDQKDLGYMEELLKLEIVSVGYDVKQFAPKQLVSLKDKAPFPYSILESNTEDGYTIQSRVAVIGMHHIEFAVNPENYEL